VVGAAVLSAALVAAVVGGCTLAAATAQSSAGPIHAKAARDGLHVDVTISTTSTARAMRFTIVAQDRHARGALAYAVSYGDGTGAHNIVPMFCQAGLGSARHGRWRLLHRYGSAGTYHAAVTVEVNCGGPGATARAVVRVR
jgi:hypothetical protein